MDDEQKQRQLANDLGAVIDRALDTTPPLLILKILASISEDLRAVNTRLEIGEGFRALSASIAKHQNKVPEPPEASFIS